MEIGLGNLGRRKISEYFGVFRFFLRKNFESVSAWGAVLVFVHLFFDYFVRTISLLRVYYANSNGARNHIGKLQPRRICLFCGKFYFKRYTAPSRFPLAMTRLNSSSRFLSSFSPRLSNIICVVLSNSSLSLRYLYNLSRQNCIAIL